MNRNHLGVMGAISAPRKLPAPRVRARFPPPRPLWYLDFWVDSKFVCVVPKGNSCYDFSVFHPQVLVQGPNKDA